MNMDTIVVKTEPAEATADFTSPDAGCALEQDVNIAASELHQVDVLYNMLPLKCETAQNECKDTADAKTENIGIKMEPADVTEVYWPKVKIEREEVPHDDGPLNAANAVKIEIEIPSSEHGQEQRDLKRTAQVDTKKVAIKTELTELVDGVCSLSTERAVQVEIEIDPTDYNETEIYERSIPERCESESSGDTSRASLEKNINSISYIVCDVPPNDVTLKANPSKRLNHTAVKSHSCIVCFKTFAHRGNLSKHMMTHTGDKPHHCKVCAKTFSHKGNLSKHMLTHTGDKPHSCSVCSKTFAQKANLSKHMFLHTGDKPYRCDVCFKNFMRDEHLSTHMLTHTGYRPHSCSICSKTFARKDTLNKHKLTHTGRKPHHCEICSKRFSDKQHLIRHMSLHTGAKPHSCEVCHKTFADKANLSRHVLIHTGDKPHRCGVCTKSFTQKATLLKHISTHTGQKGYPTSLRDNVKSSLRDSK